MAGKNAEVLEIVVADLESLKSMVARHSDALKGEEKWRNCTDRAQGQAQAVFVPVLLLLGLLSQTPIDLGEATRATG
jgi:hypothetical protein